MPSTSTRFRGKSTTTSSTANTPIDNVVHQIISEYNQENNITTVDNVESIISNYNTSNNMATINDILNNNTLTDSQVLALQNKIFSNSYKEFLSGTNIYDIENTSTFQALSYIGSTAFQVYYEDGAVVEDLSDDDYDNIFGGGSFNPSGGAFVKNKKRYIYNGHFKDNNKISKLLQPVDSISNESGIDFSSIRPTSMGYDKNTKTWSNIGNPVEILTVQGFRTIGKNQGTSFELDPYYTEEYVIETKDNVPVSERYRIKMTCSYIDNGNDTFSNQDAVYFTVIENYGKFTDIKNGIPLIAKVKYDNNNDLKTRTIDFYGFGGSLNNSGGENSTNYTQSYSQFSDGSVQDTYSFGNNTISPLVSSNNNFTYNLIDNNYFENLLYNNDNSDSSNSSLKDNKIVYAQHSGSSTGRWQGNPDRYYAGTGIQKISRGRFPNKTTEINIKNPLLFYYDLDTGNKIPEDFLNKFPNYPRPSDVIDYTNDDDLPVEFDNLNNIYEVELEKLRGYRNTLWSNSIDAFLLKLNEYNNNIFAFPTDVTSNLDKSNYLISIYNESTTTTNSQVTKSKEEMENAMSSYFLISDNQLTKDKVFLNRGGSSTFNTTPYSISSGFTNMTSLYTGSGTAFFAIRTIQQWSVLDMILTKDVDNNKYKVKLNCSLPFSYDANINIGGNTIQPCDVDWETVSFIYPLIGSIDLKYNEDGSLMSGYDIYWKPSSFLSSDWKPVPGESNYVKDFPQIQIFSSGDDDTKVTDVKLNHESIVLGPRIRVNTELKFNLTGITEQIYNYEEIKDDNGNVLHLSLNSILYKVWKDGINKSSSNTPPQDMKDDMMYAYSIMTDEDGNYKQNYSNEYGDIVIQYGNFSYSYTDFTSKINYKKKYFINGYWYIDKEPRLYDISEQVKCRCSLVDKNKILGQNLEKNVIKPIKQNPYNQVTLTSFNEDGSPATRDADVSYVEINVQNPNPIADPTVDNNYINDSFTGIPAFTASQMYIDKFGKTKITPEYLTDNYGNISEEYFLAFQNRIDRQYGINGLNYLTKVSYSDAKPGYIATSLFRTLYHFESQSSFINYDTSNGSGTTTYNDDINSGTLSNREYNGFKSYYENSLNSNTPVFPIITEDDEITFSKFISLYKNEISVNMPTNSLCELTPYNMNTIYGFSDVNYEKVKKLKVDNSNLTESFYLDTDELPKYKPVNRMFSLYDHSWNQSNSMIAQYGVEDYGLRDLQTSLINYTIPQLKYKKVILQKNNNLVLNTKTYNPLFSENGKNEYIEAKSTSEMLLPSFYSRINKKWIFEDQEDTIENIESVDSTFQSWNLSIPTGNNFSFMELDISTSSFDQKKNSGSIENYQGDPYICKMNLPSKNALLNHDNDLDMILTYLDNNNKPKEIVLYYLQKGQSIESCLFENVNDDVACIVNSETKLYADTNNYNKNDSGDYSSVQDQTGKVMFNPELSSGLVTIGTSRSPLIYYITGYDYALLEYGDNAPLSNSVTDTDVDNNLGKVNLSTDNGYVEYPLITIPNGTLSTSSNKDKYFQKILGITASKPYGNNLFSKKTNEGLYKYYNESEVRTVGGVLIGSQLIFNGYKVDSTDMIKNQPIINENYFLDKNNWGGDSDSGQENKQYIWMETYNNTGSVADADAAI